MAKRKGKKRKKYPHKRQLTEHHRKPVSRCADGGGKISIIPRYKHEAWHAIVGNATIHEAAEILNKYYVDPDYKLVVTIA